MPTEPALPALPFSARRPWPTREVTTHADLLAATQGDPYVRWGVPTDLPRAWVCGTAGAWVRRRLRQGTWSRGLTAVGAGDELAAVVEAALAATGCEGGLTSVSLPVGHDELHERIGSSTDRGLWDWMWTTAEPPTRPGELVLEVLDDVRDAGELRELNDRWSPTAEGDPGTGTCYHWVGRREGGELVAAGALQPLDSGTPHLANIVTAGPWRGRGLGADITSALTRVALRSDGVATLGMYADNDTARALYERLGYRVAQAWDSRRVA